MSFIEYNPYSVNPYSLYSLNAPTINPTAINPTTMYPAMYPTNIGTILPYAPAITSDMTHPFIPSYLPNIVTYPNVNTNKELRKQTTEKYYDTAINNWLKYSPMFSDIYNYISVSNNKASVISDINKQDTKSDDASKNLKLQYIIHNILTKKYFYNILTKFTQKYNVNWWDIKDHTHELKSYLSKKIIHNLEGYIYSHDKL